MPGDTGEPSRRSSAASGDKYNKAKRAPSKLKRVRARDRWRRIQRHVRSASLAFSVAGLERRKGFVERRWSTIPSRDPAHALTRGESAPTGLLQERHGQRAKEKSVSFEDEHDFRINR